MHMHKRQFTAIIKFVTTWTDNKNKFKTTLDQASLKLAIGFLLVFYLFPLVSYGF